MPEKKPGRMARTYDNPKTNLPKRGERTTKNKERTKPQLKTKGKMGY